jgi:hypothetical protein
LPGSRIFSDVLYQGASHSRELNECINTKKGIRERKPVVKVFIQYKRKTEELNIREMELLQLALGLLKNDLMRHRTLAKDDRDYIDLCRFMMKLKIV